MALAGRFSIPTIIPSIFSITAVSGLFIILVGNHNPFLFTLAVAPATVAISMLRPPSMNILLEQGKKRYRRRIFTDEFFLYVYGEFGGTVYFHGLG